MASIPKKCGRNRFPRRFKQNNGQNGADGSMAENCIIITGATGYLGKAFINELIYSKELKSGLESGETSLVLTGRSEEKLTALKSGIPFRAEIFTKAMDLSSEVSRGEFFEALSARGERVKMLINVAGADIQKPFENYTQEKLLFQCRANFEGAAAMCLYAVQHAAKKAKIINISSVSGIYPMPYFAVYSATKGALTSFSQALSREVKKRGITVTVILPGAMPTREDVREQIRGQKAWGKLAAEPPSLVARKSLRAAEKGKRKAIIGFWNKLMNAATKPLPLSLKMKFIEKRWSKISKDAF